MEEWDKWAASLPEPHRKGIIASEGITDELERTSEQPNVLMNMLRGTYPRQVANFFQVAVAEGFAGQNKVMRWHDFKVLFKRFPSYAHLRPLLVRIASDLCGTGNHPLGIGFIEYRGMGRTAEHDAKIARRHGIPDEAHERTWFIVLTGDHKHGGDIYFPARKTAIKAKPGTAFVVPRTARWGIAPIADHEWQKAGSGQRVMRLMIGWGSRDKRFAEYGGFPAPERRIIIDPTKPLDDDVVFDDGDEEEFDGKEP